MRKFRLLVGTMGAVLLTVGSAFAASQGTLTTGTSEATADINLTIPTMVKITGVADINVTLTEAQSAAGIVEADTTQDICIYSNATSGAYDIKFTCTNGTGAGTDCVDGYKLTNGTDTIVYGVKVNDQTGTSGSVSAAYGTKVDGTGANQTDEDCASGGDSGSFAITVSKAELQKAHAGNYEGTLHIFVYPDQG
ncbi:MAG: hypothetical protein GYA55_09610 [SAR324 cluster bacterium]|uniref:Spore coat protein U domain-containing protein n=1 Tax=SAR324 cluster bacterium TaxID=2024889 RepID=A0A7X9FSB6_9DELT|nr:hypothetical protein [SAR324 cluster bacterium]